MKKSDLVKIMVYEGMGVYYNPKLGKIYLKRDSHYYSKPYGSERIALNELGLEKIIEELK